MNSFIKSKPLEYWIVKAAYVLVLSACLLLALQRVFYWTAHPLFVCSDQSVYLAMAELILAGKIPYRDFFDFNPPLIMYLNVVPIMVARLFHLPPPLALALVVEALHAISILVMAALLYVYRKSVPVLPFLPFLFAYAYFTTLMENDMGQREHLFTFFFMPYFLLRGIRHFGTRPSNWFSIPIGFFCGLLLSLKPQFFFLAFCAELGFLLSSRNWRALISFETLSLLVAPIGYILLFLRLPREALKVLFEQALPIYQYGTIWSSKCFPHMLCSYDYFIRPFLQLVGSLTIAFLILPTSLGRSRAGAWLSPFIFICLGAMVVYIQGAQAWTYRLLPMALFAQVLLAYEAGLICSAPLFKAFQMWKGFSLLAALAVFGGTAHYANLCIEEYRIVPPDRFDINLEGLGYSGFSPRNDFDETFFSMIENSQPDEKIVHIGSGIRPGYPAQLQSGRAPGSRYLYFMITMIRSAVEVNPKLKDKFAAIEKQVVDNLGEDILKNRPNLVYLQDFPVRDALQEHHFVERFLGNYTEIGTVDSTRIYRLTGGKFNYAAFGVWRRAEIAMAVLRKELTAEQAAAKYQLPVEVVNDWVKRAKAGLLRRLSDRSLDREAEMQKEIYELNDRLFKLNLEKGELEQELFKLKEKQ